MRTAHGTFSLAGHTVHRVDFAPETFTDADLLWLPHHEKFSHAASKRKAEHLAGRIAAAHALKAHGITAVPGTGSSGEPLWPAGFSGSISHTSRCALAVVATNALTGIDCEIMLPAGEAEEIKDGIIGPDEEPLLRAAALPFALALTLAFSAKESLFKALYPAVGEMMGFDCARVTALDDESLTLALTRPLAGFGEGFTFRLPWLREDTMLIALLHSAPAASR
ncbi:enterobactin synthase subunit EntD [Enterobacter sp. KBR-315C3_2022]|uniref:enterobactin synthase subunit EntD n=1 Tax=Enterobacter sp. KBR-315C3_2022 TaxID=3242494 RepID=UPI00352822F5